MTTYVIGDIQGCLAPLEKLLASLHFNPTTDTLWFTGDLVNRGPRSLDVLRFIKTLGEKHITVLGNHDLHLLAVAYGVGIKHKNDTLDAILTAPDRDELITWLRHRPLFFEDPASSFVMAHAGLAPTWTREQARYLANEVEVELRRDAPSLFLQQLYGNQPDVWHDDLVGMDRLRCIVNYFTRMRYCYPDGRLELSFKGALSEKPVDLIPWFDVQNRVNKDIKILFGHWAALNGKTDVPNIYPLDTGCVWGNCLTAMRLEDEKKFSVKC